MKNRTFLISTLSLMIFSALLISCGDDAPTIDPPRAIFEFEVADDNSGTVNFTDLSVDADSYLWDFGDQAGTSTEANPSYTYTSSGKYTVKLTVTNEGGTDETTLEVSVSPNIVNAGDMSDESAWTFRNVWDDNVVNHAFIDETFVWDNGEGASYSQAYLWQEVAVEAGKTYKFAADISSTSGTANVWFELYFGNADPAEEGDYGSNGLRLYVSSFDSPDSGCANDPFDGDFVSVAQNCTPDEANTKILPVDGTFTLTAEELTGNGTIYLVFKSGVWDSADNYKDGIVLDNVSIVEVL